MHYLAILVSLIPHNLNSAFLFRLNSYYLLLYMDHQDLVDTILI
jgi:hypothetical protein